MVKMHPISYNEFLKKSLHAELRIDDRNTNDCEQNVYYQIECPSGTILTVQYNIGMVPIIKKLPYSDDLALSLNCHIYLINLENMKIEFSFVSNTVCEMIKIYAEDLFFVCEAEIIVFNVPLKKIIQTIYLPEMVVNIDEDSAGKLFISLYDQNHYTIKKENNQYQIQKIENRQ